jgi:starch phosphorylase
VRVVAVEVQAAPEVQVGQEVQVKARVQLGPLRPQDVAVELCLGRVDGSGRIVGADTQPMSPCGRAREGVVPFGASAIVRESGLYGYTVRVLPHHPDLAVPFLPGLIVWA